MQKRCDRNRKRSKRRAIYCPHHGCYLDSVSQKYKLFADQAHQLQARGIGRRQSLLLIATQTTIALKNEWLEAFWCPLCHKTIWYHIIKESDRTYSLITAPPELWKQVEKVQYPNGNPSISEFTRRQACSLNPLTAQDFKSIFV